MAAIFQTTVSNGFYKHRTANNIHATNWNFDHKPTCITQLVRCIIGIQLPERIWFFWCNWNSYILLYSLEIATLSNDKNDNSVEKNEIPFLLNSLIMHTVFETQSKSCRSSCLESNIINIKLKKNQQKISGPPPKLLASDWWTCGNFQHWMHIMACCYLAPVHNLNHCKYMTTSWRLVLKYNMWHLVISLKKMLQRL